MRSAGFTLIELLVVISIIAIMSVVGFTNFKTFSADQVAVKGAGQIQSLLRLAQSNATTATLCDNSGSTSWSLVLKNNNEIELHCSKPGDYTHKKYSLENAEMESVECSNNMPVNLSVSLLTFSYASLSGSVTFLSSEACVKNTSSLKITLKNKNEANAKKKTITISKGGTIDVQ